MFYKKVQNEIEASYLKYESSVDLRHALLIQEMIVGQEYGLDVINDLEGQYQNRIVKKKIAIRSGETDCAITENRSDIRELGKQISKKLGHIANLDVDVFVREDCKYVFEMNARFGGGYPFSHLAGVDLPETIVNWV